LTWLEEAATLVWEAKRNWFKRLGATGIPTEIFFQQFDCPTNPNAAKVTDAARKIPIIGEAQDVTGCSLAEAGQMDSLRSRHNS
jgi:hypothetical protein